MLLPGRSHSPFALLRPQGVVKAAYVYAQRLIFFRRHGPRHRCPAGRPRSAIVPLDASPEEREEAVSWGCCYPDCSSALQVASRLLTASCALGLSETVPPRGGFCASTPRQAALSSAKFLSAGAVLAQALRPSNSQPPHRFLQRPTAARGSAASRPRPTSAVQQLLPPLLRRRFSTPPLNRGGGERLVLPIPPRVEGSGRFPVDVGHCSRLRHPSPLSLPSPASFSDASRLDHVTLFDAEVEALQEERAIVEVSPSSPGSFVRLFLVPKPVGRRPFIGLKRLYSLFVDCPRFRVDTLRDVSLLLQPGIGPPPSTSRTRFPRRGLLVLPLPPLLLARPVLAVLRPSLRSAPRSTHPHRSVKDAKALLLLRGIRFIWWMDDILILGSS